MPRHGGMCWGNFRLILSIGKSFWTWSGGCLLPPWHIFTVRAFLHNPGQPLPKEWIENLVFLFVTIQDSPLNQRPQSPLCRGRGR